MDACIRMRAVACAAICALAPHSDALAHDSHPQEVLDLVAAHHELAMKIRPLQDRVIVSRTKPSDATRDDTAAETRVSERLRHKNRAAADSEEMGRIKVRLARLEKKAAAERERIHAPEFGVRFGDGRRGARLPSGQKAENNAAADTSIDKRAIADARKKLAALQREFATLEQEIEALQRR